MYTRIPAGFGTFPQACILLYIYMHVKHAAWLCMHAVTLQLHHAGHAIIHVYIHGILLSMHGLEILYI